MHFGVIKCYGSCGFGFITRDGESGLFFHVRDSPQANEADLETGSRVQFSVFDTSMGTRAADIRLVE